MKWFSLIDDNGYPFNMTEGKVRAIIEMPEEDIAKSFVPDIFWFPLTEDNVEEGWLYKNGVFSPPPEPEQEPDPVPEPVTQVSQRQIRLLLIDLDMDEMVETAINSLSGKEGKKARVEWEKASYIDRNNPLIDMIGGALGLTPEEIDVFFEEASHY